MKVAVFGLGYVGTVTAAGLASCGHDVVGVDVDPLKVEAINDGRSPVVEPGIAELVSAGVSGGHLTATTSPVEALAGADISLVCVGTPSAALGDTDLTYIRRATDDIRSAMDHAVPPASGFHSVVIRSTVPPGTGAGVVAPKFGVSPTPVGWTVGTAMCPEFLREGSGVQDFYDPPFVVVGTDDERTLAALGEMFAFLDEPVRHVSVATAEALKFACNAFHATKVTFANEIARVFRGFDVDSREVMELFCEDTKLNISRAYLRPGFAFGGSCLPKDLRSLHFLARTKGVEVPLLVGTMSSNEVAVRDVVSRVVETRSRRVCLLGLSFKMDTDDLRESPNVELAERLLGKGFDLRIYDPIIHPDRLVGSNREQIEARLPHLRRLLAHTPAEALEEADVVIVATSDAEALGALCQRTPKLILDLHGRLGHEVELMAAYQGVGW